MMIFNISPVVNSTVLFPETSSIVEFVAVGSVGIDSVELSEDPSVPLELIKVLFSGSDMVVFPSISDASGEVTSSGDSVVGFALSSSNSDSVVLTSWSLAVVGEGVVLLAGVVVSGT